MPTSTSETTEAVIISGPRKREIVDVDPAKLAAREWRAIDSALEDIISAFDGLLGELDKTKAHLRELNAKLDRNGATNA